MFRSARSCEKCEKNGKWSPHFTACFKRCETCVASRICDDSPTKAIPTCKMSWYVCRSPPATPWLDPAVDRFGQGMGCASYQKHLSGPCPTKKCVFGSPHQPKSIQILDTVGAKLCHLSWQNKLDQVLWGCDFLPHQLCASVHTPPNSLFPRIWTNYNDNESLVTWLHHVTSHFFLPPAPVKFPVKSPVPEMPKSPAVAQGCQSMALDETTAGEKWLDDTGCSEFIDL